MAMVSDVIALEDRMSASLGQISSLLASIDSKMDKVKVGSDEIGDSMEKSGKKIEDNKNKFSVWGMAAGQVIGNVVSKIAQLSTQLVSTGVNYNAQMEMYTSNFTVMLGSVEAAVSKVEQLKEFAAKTPFGMNDLASATQTLLSFGIAEKSVMPIMQQLGDISLGNKERFQGLALAFSQTYATGRLMGQDLNQMINQGFNPLQIISEKTGKSMAQLKDEMERGLIPFSQVADAFRIATAEGGRFFNGMDEASKTFSGQMSTLKDNLSATFGTMFLPITNVMRNKILPKVNGYLDKIQSKVEKIASKIENVVDNSVDFIIENLEAIKLSLIALGGIVTFFSAKWFIAWTVANWQIVLIIGGIVLLAAILNNFGITSEQVLSVLGGSFAALGASIWNTLLAIVEFTFGIINYSMNMLTTFGNFVANFLNNPVASIIYLIQGMADTVLGLIENIASAIDHVFGSNLSNAVSGWRNSLKGIADLSVQKWNDLTGNSYTEYFKKIEFSTEALGLNSVDVKKALDSGSQFGLNLNDSIENTIKSVGDATNGLLGQTNNLLSGEGSLKSGGEVEIDGENLKWLLDIATRRQVREYQSTPISVQVTTGDIHEQADEDRLANRVAAVLNNSINQNLSV